MDDFEETGSCAFDLPDHRPVHDIQGQFLQEARAFIKEPPADELQHTTARFERNAECLLEVRSEAHPNSREFRFGVFGTAIDGTRLGPAVGESRAFFVDEDERRTGREPLRHPVIPPRHPAKSDAVHLAFPRELAYKLQDQLAPGSPATHPIPPA